MAAIDDIKEHKTLAEGVKPITLKCTVCGGELKADYLSGDAVCAHCSNRWALRDILPDYGKYAKSLEKIKKANDLLSGKPDVTAAAEAKLLFQQASSECYVYSETIATDIHRISAEGTNRAEKMKTYARGYSHFERKAYTKALEEFEKIPDFQDSAELIEKCKNLQVTERRKLIPLAILIGMILPAVLGIVLYEKAGLPLYVDIPIFVLGTAGLSYLVYREKKFAVVIEVLSFLAAVPLILFLILAYGMGMETKAAAAIAIGAPVAFVLAAGFKAGGGNNGGNT